MSEELLIDLCSPTLAGLKTASLISVTYEDELSMKEDVRSLNEMLVEKGIRVVPLQFKDGRALIYFYRPCQLSRDISCARARELLSEIGYHTGNAGKCVTRLAQRIKESSEFPHEIGFFLGYPTEDVIGFITNKGRNCKACGLWKVYGDVEAAEKRFRQCRKCCDVYKQCWRQGKSIEELTVRINRPVAIN